MVALLRMQLRGLGVVMSSELTVSVSLVRLMRRLLVLLGLIVLCCFVEMVSRLLMMTSGVMIMFPSF